MQGPRFVFLKKKKEKRKKENRRNKEKQRNCKPEFEQILSFERNLVRNLGWGLNVIRFSGVKEGILCAGAPTQGSNCSHPSANPYEGGSRTLVDNRKKKKKKKRKKKKENELEKEKRKRGPQRGTSS